MHCPGQEADGNLFARRKSEGDVAYAQHRVQPQLLGYIAHRAQRLLCLFLLCGYRERQTVDEYVFPGDPVRERRIQNPFGNAAAAHPVLRDAV